MVRFGPRTGLGVNSMMKMVQSKDRASLLLARVIKLVYCYVNLRLFDDADSTIVDMLDAALTMEAA